MLSVPMNKEVKEKSLWFQTKAYGMLSKREEEFTNYPKRCNKRNVYC